MLKKHHSRTGGSMPSGVNRTNAGRPSFPAGAYPSDPSGYSIPSGRPIMPEPAIPSERSVPSDSVILSGPSVPPNRGNPPAAIPGRHTLEPLPYAYNALEPVIDETTVRLHHDKHQRAYVEGLNAAEIALADARAKNDYTYIKYWEDQLAFNGSGVLLHALYWRNMRPLNAVPETGGLSGDSGTNRPPERASSLLDAFFGGFDTFKAQFSKAAATVQGSGWCMLCYSPTYRNLYILQCEKHQNLVLQAACPVLVCDVWEHAYYLKYKNDRANYIENWWRLVNWRYVEDKLSRFVF